MAGVKCIRAGGNPVRVAAVRMLRQDRKRRETEAGSRREKSGLSSIRPLFRDPAGLAAGAVFILPRRPAER